MKKLRIVFFGTPEFAATSLRRLAQEACCEVCGVVTATDKPAGRGHKLLQSDVKKAALELGLPVLQPERLRSEEFLEALRALGADLFVVIAFRMLPKAVWGMPRLGTFNLHASLLPRYRGAAPINWALINGDERTGVTTFFLNEDIDTGPIIDSEAVDILPEDDLGSLYERLMHLGADLTLKTVRALSEGPVASHPQPDGEEAPAPKIFADTCRIDWTLPARRVHNLVRGLSPVPGARAELASPIGGVKVLRTAVVDGGCGLTPGEWRAEGGRLTVGCGDGSAVDILELQPQGKRRMPVRDYLNGLRI